MSESLEVKDMSHEWCCETNGCKIKNGYCVMCGVSADGARNKPIRSQSLEVGKEISGPAERAMCEFLVSKFTVDMKELQRGLQLLISVRAEVKEKQSAELSRLTRELEEAKAPIDDDSLLNIVLRKLSTRQWESLTFEKYKDGIDLTTLSSPAIEMAKEIRNWRPQTRKATGENR